MRVSVLRRLQQPSPISHSRVHKKDEEEGEDGEGDTGQNVHECKARQQVSIGHFGILTNQDVWRLPTRFRFVASKGNTDLCLEEEQTVEEEENDEDGEGDDGGFADAAPGVDSCGKRDEDKAVNCEVDGQPHGCGMPRGGEVLGEDVDEMVGC